MTDQYYQPCEELTRCDELITRCFNKGDYEACFTGHLELAEKGYPLAECQVGYFYHEGLGVAPDPAKAIYWTQRAADHGDRDGQCNLAWFYEEGIGMPVDLDKAKHWYRLAALQNHDLAIEKCREYGISLT